MYIHVPVITCIYNTHICEYQYVCLQHTCIHVCGVHGYVHVQLTLSIVSPDLVKTCYTEPIDAHLRSSYSELGYSELGYSELGYSELGYSETYIHVYVHKTLSRERVNVF